MQLTADYIYISYMPFFFSKYIYAFFTSKTINNTQRNYKLG
jgi:hypothetical protein